MDRERASMAAGGRGGRARGDSQEPASLTGQYLSGAGRDRAAEDPPPFRQDAVFRLRGARGEQSQEYRSRAAGGPVRVRDGRLGFGQSTLINDTLYHAVARELYGSVDEPAAHDSIKDWNSSTRR